MIGASSLFILIVMSHMVDVISLNTFRPTVKPTPSPQPTEYPTEMPTESPTEMPTPFMIYKNTSDVCLLNCRYNTSRLGDNNLCQFYRSSECAAPETVATFSCVPSCLSVGKCFTDFCSLHSELALSCAPVGKAKFPAKLSVNSLPTYDLIKSQCLNNALPGSSSIYYTFQITLGFSSMSTANSTASIFSIPQSQRALQSTVSRFMTGLSTDNVKIGKVYEYGIFTPAPPPLPYDYALRLKRASKSFNLADPFPDILYKRQQQHNEAPLATTQTGGDEAPRRLVDIRENAVSLSLPKNKKLTASNGTVTLSISVKAAWPLTGGDTLEGVMNGIIADFSKSLSNGEFMAFLTQEAAEGYGAALLGADSSHMRLISVSASDYSVYYQWLPSSDAAAVPFEQRNAGMISGVSIGGFAFMMGMTYVAYRFLYMKRNLVKVSTEKAPDNTSPVVWGKF